MIYCAQAYFKKLNQQKYYDTLSIYDENLGTSKPKIPNTKSFFSLQQTNGKPTMVGCWPYIVS